MSRLFDDEVLDAPATAAGQEQRPEAPRVGTANRKQVQLRPCARGPRPVTRKLHDLERGADGLAVDSPGDAQSGRTHAPT